MGHPIINPKKPGFYYTHIDVKILVRIVKSISKGIQVTAEKYYWDGDRWYVGDVCRTDPLPIQNRFWYDPVRRAIYESCGY